MDETFVFLRKGSKRRPSQIATNTVDREDILCSIPKPSYRFLLISSDKTTLYNKQILLIVKTRIEIKGQSHCVRDICSQIRRKFDGRNYNVSHPIVHLGLEVKILANSPGWLAAAA